MTYKDIKRKGGLDKLLNKKTSYTKLYDFLQEYKNGYFRVCKDIPNYTLEYDYIFCGEDGFKIIIMSTIDNVVYRIQLNFGLLKRVDTILNEHSPFEISLSMYKNIRFLLEYIEQEFGLAEGKKLKINLEDYNEGIKHGL